MSLLFAYMQGISVIAEKSGKAYRKPGLLWTWGLLWTDFVKMLSDALKYFKRIILLQLTVAMC